MKEITRITTLKITEVFKAVNEADLQEKTKYGEKFAEDVKLIFQADDVDVVGEVQDFVRDV